LKLLSEARESLGLGAFEANATIALAIGYRRAHAISQVSRSRTGVDSRATAFPHVIRQAEGAHHIAVRFAKRIDITNVLLAGGPRIAELKTDTVTFHYVALAVGEPVINETAGLSAEGVLLVLANHEGWLGAEGSYRGEELDGR
jgi:hypothetical protein